MIRDSRFGMPFMSTSIPLSRWRHPRLSRRTMLQAGAIGLLGLGMNEVEQLRATAPAGVSAGGKAKACVYIFLSGGLAQHESFDLKPAAPAEVRGEFNPVATKTPGIQISEHLPRLAQRSEQWAIVRSLTHSTNDHTLAHYLMLTGRNIASPGFRGDRQPRGSDWPSIASIAGNALPQRNHNLPPAVVLPEKLVHWSGGTIPGAFGGLMGRNKDPFFVEASPYGNPFWRGAYPEFTFANEAKKPPQSPDQRVYLAPQITLAPGMTLDRLGSRSALLSDLDRQRQGLQEAASVRQYDMHREAVVSLLADGKVRRQEGGSHDDRVFHR